MIIKNIIFFVSSKPVCQTLSIKFLFTLSRIYLQSGFQAFYLLFTIKLFAHIYNYMSAIAGQTVGPNGLNFLREPIGTLGLNKSKKNSNIFLKIFFNSPVNGGHLS